MWLSFALQKQKYIYGTQGPKRYLVQLCEISSRRPEPVVWKTAFPS